MQFHLQFRWCGQRVRRQLEQVGRKRLVELVVADVDEHEFRLERQQLEAADGLFFLFLQAERRRRLICLESGGDALQQVEFQLVRVVLLGGPRLLELSFNWSRRLLTISRSANISSSRKRAVGWPGRIRCSR